jgi:hypothetical protein
MPVFVDRNFPAQSFLELIGAVREHAVRKKRVLDKLICIKIP